MKEIFKNLKKKMRNIDLISGTRKGEIMFRKIFFLLAMALFIYFLLLTFVGKKEDNAQEKEVVVEKVVVEEKVIWLEDGSRRIERGNTVEITPAEVFMSKEELDKRSEDKVKAERIRVYFSKRRSELANYAEVFVEVANKNNLDYRLLPAIATYESGAGKSNFRQYNPFGWGSKGFSSYEEAIEVVGKGLNVYYGKGLDTIEKISSVYCPPNSTNWAKNVREIMSDIESVSLSK